MLALRERLPLILGLAIGLGAPTALAVKGRGTHPNPGFAEIKADKPGGLCVYEDCKSPAAGTFELRVTRQQSSYRGGGLTVIGPTTGETQTLGLCAMHAVYAREGKWPDRYWYPLLALSPLLGIAGAGCGLIIRDWLRDLAGWLGRQ